MIKSKIFMADKIKNKNPRPQAKDEYIHVYVVDDNGIARPAFLTEYDLEKAITRAANNLEDVLPEHKEQTLISKVFSWMWK